MNKLWNLIFGKNESVKHARNYMMGQIVNKGLGFFLMPITTALMTTADYGTNSIFTSLVNIFVIIMPLCLYRGVTRFHYDKQYDTKEILGKQFLLMMITMTILGIFMGITLQLWNGLTGMTYYLTILMLLHSYAQSIINFYLAYLQSRKASAKYAFLNVLLALFTTLLGIYWMMQMDYDRFFGLIYANLLCRFLFAVYGIFDMWKDMKFVRNQAMTQEVWRFCLPLIPHMISGVILNYVDRLMISNMVGMSAAGLYSFAYNFGFIVNIVVYAINQTWGPEFFELMNHKNYKVIGSRLMNYQNALLSVTALIVFFAREVTIIMANPKYHSAVELIPMICYGYVLFHLYSTLSNYGTYYKKTGFLAVVSAIAALFNIVTNYIGILYFGYQAAAFTTALSYLVQYILYELGNRYIMKCEMHNLHYFLVKTLAFCIGTQLLILGIHALQLNIWITIGIKGLVTLAVLYLIWQGSDRYELHS